MNGLIYMFLIVFASFNLVAQEQSLSKITISYKVKGEVFSSYAQIDKNSAYNSSKGELQINLDCQGKGYQLVSLATENTSAVTLLSNANEYLVILRQEVKTLMAKSDEGNKTFKTKGDSPMLLTISWKRVGKNKYEITETIELIPQLASN